MILPWLNIIFMFNKKNYNYYFYYDKEINKNQI